MLLALSAAAACLLWLPLDLNARKGLALLVFIGLLWLTEALPLPVILTAGAAGCAAAGL